MRVLAEKTEFAIVDIETTGGSASSAKITEIAVVVTDGVRIIERWDSLVQPHQNVPFHITALTGISDEMLYDAPAFGEISAKVHALLQGRVFVAHNVNFDYSFVKKELHDAGVMWDSTRLCTVRLTRKLIPGLPSYSLGRLCDYLQISIRDRHRAGGDVEATAVLFHQLLERPDASIVLSAMLKKGAKDPRIPLQIQANCVDALPSTPGVYYFINQQKKVIYVGKAENIKKRVISHFTGHNISSKRQAFLSEISDIRYQESANPWMALLLEATEIARLWPRYNKALKNVKPKYALIEYVASNSVHHLAIVRKTTGQQCLRSFYSLSEAISCLRGLIETFALDLAYCRFLDAKRNASSPKNEVVISETMDIEGYNQQVAGAVAALTEQYRSYLVVDKGRHDGESTCIAVLEDQVYSFGYLEHANQPSDVEQWKDALPRYHGSEYMMGIIRKYIEDSETAKIIPISSLSTATAPSFTKPLSQQTSLF